MQRMCLSIVQKLVHIMLGVSCVLKKKKSIFDDDNSHNLDIFLMYFMNHIALPIKTIQPFKYLNTDFLFLFFLNLTCLGYVPSYIFTLL